MSKFVEVFDDALTTLAIATLKGIIEISLSRGAIVETEPFRMRRIERLPVSAI